MTAFIMKAGKYARVGGIVVQALTLVLAITEQIGHGVAKESSYDSKAGE